MQKLKIGSHKNCLLSKYWCKIYEVYQIISSPYHIQIDTGMDNIWPASITLTSVSCPCLSADPYQSYQSQELKTSEKQLFSLSDLFSFRES